MSKEISRKLTRRCLLTDLNKILKNYMTVYDEYYETGSRDSAFLKDLVNGIIGISAVLEVYVKHKEIHPKYALEKLNSSQRYINATIKYFERKEEENAECNS